MCHCAENAQAVPSNYEIASQKARDLVAFVESKRDDLSLSEYVNLMEKALGTLRGY